MIHQRKARAALLALFFLSVWSVHALAHSLPDTTLRISAEAQNLGLTIEFPLEDFLIAAPALKNLNDAPTESMLSAVSVNQLAHYLSKHIELQQIEDLPLDLELVDASLHVDENEHVGQFKLLRCNLRASLRDGETIFPLTLRYDAVMHEVRNHRVGVYWVSASSETIKLVEFGYKKRNGLPMPVVIQESG